MIGVKSSKQVRGRAFQTLHLKEGRPFWKGEEVTQFREWRETPQSQSEKAKRRLDETGDTGRDQAMLGPVRRQVRELGLDFHGHRGSRGSTETEAELAPEVPVSLSPSVPSASNTAEKGFLAVTFC